MELPQRKGDDRFLPVGHYRSLKEKLRANVAMHDVCSLVVSAFDRATRMLPFVYFDWRTVPCGPRSIAAALADAGMTRTRFVYQLWNPKIQVSLAKLDSAAIDMLLISSMQVHSASTYKLINDAWSMGEDRPLIIVGGPKGTYEPFDCFGLGPDGKWGADVVVTGEESVLLELLTVLADFGGKAGQMRGAFDRAKSSGALNDIPGLVFSRDDSHSGYNLINTGVQRLLRDLDELPLTSVGYGLLEPPHRGKTLSRLPLPIEKAGGGSMVTTLLMTRGCKYNCHFCPIPAYNQKCYRHKSPARIAEEFVDCYNTMNTKYIFGADDNFFNSRRYSEELIEALASTQIKGKRLGQRMRFGTECTIADAYKMRDLLPFAGRGQAGLAGLWMGVEDLSGRLVDKGQNAEITKELFKKMLRHDISPMVMMIHFDDQPLRSPGSLDGLTDQMRFLFNAGAVSAQCTVINPAVGSRWLSDVYKDGLQFESVGSRKVQPVDFDGNHVLASKRRDAWRVQLNMLIGYATFYNPINFCRALFDKNRYLVGRRLFYQAWGMAGLVRTAWMLKGHFWRLATGKITFVKDWPIKFRRAGSPYPDLILDDDKPEQMDLQVTQKD